MTTIAETTATQQSMINDIADTAIGTGFWSEGDADFTNDNSTGDWWNNSRVIQNNATGEYLLFYPEGHGDVGHDSYKYLGNINGVRIIRSTGWRKDTTNFNDASPGAPSQKTTVYSRDNTINGDVPGDERREDSFTTFTANWGDKGQSAGLWHGSHSPTDDVRYFGSVGQHHLTLAAWSDEDVRNDGTGEASFYIYENLQNQFFAHGTTPPVVTASRVQHGDSEGNCDPENPYPTTSFGWSNFYACEQNNKGNYPGGVGATNGAIGQGEWGYLNPHPGDNTFLYRRAAAYSAENQQIPVAEVMAALPAEWGNGISHGDTVTVDTATYRGFEKTGDSNGGRRQAYNCKIGLRYD